MVVLHPVYVSPPPPWCRVDKPEYMVVLRPVYVSGRGAGLVCSHLYSRSILKFFYYYFCVWRNYGLNLENNIHIIKFCASALRLTDKEYVFNGWLPWSQPAVPPFPPLPPWTSLLSAVVPPLERRHLTLKQNVSSNSGIMGGDHEMLSSWFWMLNTLQICRKINPLPTKCTFDQVLSLPPSIRLGLLDPRLVLVVVYIVVCITPHPPRL